MNPRCNEYLFVSKVNSTILVIHECQCEIMFNVVEMRDIRVKLCLTVFSLGGTGFLIREPFTQLPTSHTEFSSFESSSVTLKLPHSKISVFNIYRPPSSSTFSKPFSVWIDIENRYF